MNLRKWFALAWGLVVCLLLAADGTLWLGKRIAPDTDILALLPAEEQDPVLQQAFVHMVDSAQQRLVVAIGAPEWSDARRAAEAFQAVLARHADLFVPQAAADELQSDWLGQWSRHSLVLMTRAAQENLRHRTADYWVEAARGRLYNPFSGPKLGAWRDDPFGLFGDWVQERARETPVRPRDGLLFVSDGSRQYVLLPLVLQAPAFSIAAQQRVMPVLREADAAARAQVATADILKAGVILHAADASEQAAREVSTIGMGSLIGVILLMWAAFRSPRPIVLILLSIGVGFLGAFIVCWTLFGRIHLLTLVFGASLIGVAQDYGIYFLCSRLSTAQETDSFTLLKRIMPGLLLTLLTTVTGYMGLALTPFPGLRQMALFSAFGLIFAWLTVAAWFPYIAGAKAMQAGALVRRYGALLPRWPAWTTRPASLAVSGLFMVFAVAGCLRLGVNDDIRLLQNPPPQMLKQDMAVGKLLDSPTPVQFFLVRAENAELVLQREEQLTARLDNLIAQHRLGGYQALSNWVPSLRTQQLRRELVDDKLLQDGAALSKLGADIEEGKDWAAATRAHLLESAAPLTPDEFLASSAAEPWRFLWLGDTGKGTAGIVALRGLDRAGMSAVREAGTGLEGVQWVDKVEGISSVLGKYRAYMGWVVLVSYAVVLALLWPRYRRDTWRVLAPAAVASIATLALFGLCGQALQLFHVLALMLLLGVGVDYGIFMQEHPGRKELTPWLATGLSAASTILSFGLLGLSHTPALQAFGSTMLAGTALVWLLVPCFGKVQA
ncbi:MAG TPA: MMPL family transporter [Burkholderiaceae bacterium]